jgi:hypothetical protein
MEIQIINPNEFGIEEKKANELYGNLPQLKTERDELEAQFNEVIKMDIEAPETWKKARKLRLLIQKNRTKGINVWHKTTKDFFLKGGQFVDAIKRKEVAVNERMERDLEQIEKHEEILRQKKISELQEKRVKELLPYFENAEEISLGEMESDVWQAYYVAKKKAYEEEQERIRLEEEQRKEAERLLVLRNKRESELKLYWQFVPESHPDFETLTIDEWSDFLQEMKNAKSDYDAEQERITVENERLQKERIERERQEKIKAQKTAKRNEELKPYIIFIRDYNKLLNLPDAEYEKEFSDIKIKAQKTAKRNEELKPYIIFIRDYNKLLNLPDAEYEKEFSDIKIGAEQHWEHERKEKEAEKARIEAELKKGDSDKVKDLINDLEALKTKYSFESKKNKKMYNDVNLLIDKIVSHIIN